MAKLKPKSGAQATVSTPVVQQQSVDDGEKDAQIAGLTEELNNLKQENEYLKAQ